MLPNSRVSKIGVRLYLQKALVKEKYLQKLSHKNSNISLPNLKISNLEYQKTDIYVFSPTHGFLFASSLSFAVNLG